LSPSASTPICFKGFPYQFICRDYEYTGGLRIGDINNSKIPTAPCLSDSNSRVFLAWPVFAGFVEYVLYLIFPYPMSVNVRKPGFFINIKANLH
jgi:hypothetical protein